MFCISLEAKSTSVQTCEKCRKTDCYGERNVSFSNNDIFSLAAFKKLFLNLTINLPNASRMPVKHLVPNPLK